nr:integrase, catalytic region, zinc finger, CCHC-type, peptidase aspartic, catalytic [Tanacetum cinerariifolium]
MANLSEDIQCAGSDHDHYQEAACAHHEDHMMHDSVQLDHVVDSHADYTGDSNVILYDRYVKDNEVPVVHSDVSSVPTNAFMMIYDDMCEPHDQSVSYQSRNTVVKNSLTAELATYKEHVKLYEQRAKFELTEREQKINEQLRIVIFGRNFKEETLKRELHSIKLQLDSTINHNKSMVEEVSSLKKDFKQKENKYLADFLDMKTLKEKGSDWLQEPFMPPPCQTKITRKKINDKMNDPTYVTRKVKIAPHNYSKENLLAIFTPQKQLTPEQIFWSNDLMKLKSEALKERTMVSRPIKAFTVKRDAIELKNLLIVNDNLIAECLSQEVLCVARFTKMDVANTTAEARCLALEVELANLRDTNNHDNQKELINHFSKLEVNHLNLQLKYQNFKDSIRNNPPTPDKDTPDFDSVFVIGKMQASLQGKDNDSQITKLTDHVTYLQAQNDLFRAKNDKIKQHYKELYDSIKITCAKHIEQVTKLTTKNVILKTCVSKATVNPQVSARDKHAIDVEPIIPRLRNNRDAHLDYLRHLKETVKIIRDIIEEAKLVRLRDRSIVSAYKSDSTTHRHVVTIKSQKTNVPVPPSTGVNSCPNASGSQPKSHVKSNRISPAKGVNKLPVEDQPRTNKSHLRTSNRVDSSSRLKYTVINSNSDPMYKMADVNAPSGQTPTMAPHLRADDQILPHIRWVPIGKSNCYLDLEKSQSRGGSPEEHQLLQGLYSFLHHTLNIHPTRRNRFHPRPNSPLHLPNEEPVLGYLKFSIKGTKREVFGMPIPGSLITAEIQQASYYREYLAKVAQHRRYLAGETGGVQDPPALKPTQPARKPKKQHPRHLQDEDAKYQKVWEESIKDAYALPRGTLPPVVIREPESGKHQPLPEVPGKGKAKVTKEQVAHDLLSFEEESKKVVLGAEEGGQDEGQAGPDPDAQAEDQTGSDAGAQVEDQTGLDVGAQAEGQAGSNPDETSEGQAGSNP